MTRAVLMRKHWAIYFWLKKNNKYLLDKYFPKIKFKNNNDPKKRKIQIFDFIKENKKRPSKNSENLEERYLGFSLSSYTSPASPQYDKDFHEKISKFCPARKQNRSKITNRSKIRIKRKYSLKELLEMSSLFITMNDFAHAAGSAYHSAAKQGFLDEIRKNILSSLSGKKCILNIDTGEMFYGIKEANESIGIMKYDLSIIYTIKGYQKTARGYRWAYCDEKGNIIK